MLEHDYLVRKDKNSIQLGGVMIGLALNSVYYYREKTGDPQKKWRLKTARFASREKKLHRRLLTASAKR